MEIQTINAIKRTRCGTRASMKDRASGRLPGVLYGHGEEVAHLTVDAKEFETALRQHDRVFELLIDGQKERALLKELQYDALGDYPIHADFTRVTAGEKVTVDIDIEFVGHPKGVSKGGRFIHPVTRILVECLPEAIPEKVEVRVNDLDVTESLHISDLELPEGVTCTMDPSVQICAVHAPGGGAADEEEAEAGEESSEPEVIGRKDEPEAEEGA